MDRYWLLTWRTYGTWLPGDQRGFVDPVLDEDGKRVIHNTPGTPLDADKRSLREYSQSIMKGEPVYLSAEQAGPLLEQFQETARYRGWQILAVAILANHVHLVIGAAGGVARSARAGCQPFPSGNGPARVWGAVDAADRWGEAPTR